MWRYVYAYEPSNALEVAVEGVTYNRKVMDGTKALIVPVTTEYHIADMSNAE